MFLGLFAQSALAAEQQQNLVAGVGYRVSRLGQQRGRAGDGERGELGRGDAQVGPQGGDDGPLAAAVLSLSVGLSADPRPLLASGLPR
jgi:hypothetical protein